MGWRVCIDKESGQCQDGVAAEPSGVGGESEAAECSREAKAQTVPE